MSRRRELREMMDVARLEPAWRAAMKDGELPVYEEVGERPSACRTCH